MDAFGTVVLEKTLESPLDCKEIQPVQPKDQSWVFTGSERVTGRKARGLQVEKGGSRCQTFLSLKRQEETNQRYVFFSVQI